MLGISLQHPSEWGTPEDTFILHGVAHWRVQPVPSHLQDLQPSQGTESPILNAADLVLVQLPAGEREKKGELLGQPRQRAISAPDHFCCLLPQDLTPNSLMPKTARTHRFLRSVAPRNAFLGMAWMKFSLRSLQKKEARRQMGSACKA